MTVAVRRRRFDAARDARLHVVLLHDGELFDAVAIKGFHITQPQVGALKLLPLSVPLSSEYEFVAAEHPMAKWYSVGELSKMRVVEPDG